MSDERAPILMARRGPFLAPLAPLDAEQLERFPAGAALKVKITQPRNVGRHRLYWAALQLVRDNMDEPPPLDHLHEAVKVRLGYVRTIRFSNGETARIPDSIAFDKMTEAEHREFFDRFADFVRTTIIPGLNKAAFTAQAEALLGEPA
jgi:hypothetical protein